MSAKQERDGRKFGPAGRVIVDVLHCYRITDYRFSKTKHALLTFSLGGREQRMRFACSPRDDDIEANRVRRRLVDLIETAQGAR